MRDERAVLYLGAFPWDGLGTCDAPHCVEVAVAVAAYIEVGITGTYDFCDRHVVLADKFLRSRMQIKLMPPVRVRKYAVDEVTLRHLYAQGLSVTAIARQLGFARTSVLRWFHDYGIKLRSRSKAGRLAAAAR